MAAIYRQAIYFVQRFMLPVRSSVGDRLEVGEVEARRDEAADHGLPIGERAGGLPGPGRDEDLEELAVLHRGAQHRGAGGLRCAPGAAEVDAERPAAVEHPHLVGADPVPAGLLPWVEQEVD